MSTIFTRIIQREIPADILYEDDDCLAFRDINPVAPTHFLVIPKKPIVALADMEMEDRALMGHCAWIAAQVAKTEGLQDFRVVTNNGAGAGQSVFHIHFHVIGGRPLSWPPG